MLHLPFELANPMCTTTTATIPNQKISCSLFQMFKLLFFAAAIPALLAETPSAFSLLEKNAELADLKIEPVKTHSVFKKQSKSEPHPVYRGEEQHQGRANIEPVRPKGPVIKYDPMLADEPTSNQGNRDNRVVSF